MQPLIQLFISLAFVVASPEPQVGGSLDFFIGDWELTTIDATGPGTFKEGKALSNAHYILGRRAIADDFYQLNVKGDTLYAGTSIRSINEATGKIQIVWLMPGVEGITEIEARWEDGKMKGTGKGYDGMGTFLERFTYYDLKTNSYNFSMDRSYDDGKTWIRQFSRFSAKRL